MHKAGVFAFCYVDGRVYVLTYLRVCKCVCGSILAIEQPKAASPSLVS